MADDKDKTVVAAPEGAEAPAASGGKKKLILFGGIGVGVLVIGVVLAIFVLKPMMSGSDNSETSSKGETKTAKAEKSEKAEKPKKETSHGKSGDGIVYAIEDIVVNPAGTAGSRFLSASFGIEVSSQETASRLEEREPLVRDALITILSSKTLAELTDAKQKEIMRLQIKKRLSLLLKTEDLTNVFYTDFVLQ
jgi:flagellar FliL protein